MGSPLDVASYFSIPAIEIVALVLAVCWPSVRAKRWLVSSMALFVALHVSVRLLDLALMYKWIRAFDNRGAVVLFRLAGVSAGILLAVFAVSVRTGLLRGGLAVGPDADDRGPRFPATGRDTESRGVPAAIPATFWQSLSPRQREAMVRLRIRAGDRGSQLVAELVQSGFAPSEAAAWVSRAFASARFGAALYAVGGVLVIIAGVGASLLSYSLAREAALRGGTGGFSYLIWYGAVLGGVLSGLSATLVQFKYRW